MQRSGFLIYRNHAPTQKCFIALINVQAVFFCSLSEQPFDFYGGGGGQEDFLGPEYFFHPQHDLVFLFEFNAKRILCKAYNRI